jgi:hypothetical protein
MEETTGVPGILERTVLEWILKKQVLRIWAGFV